MEIFFIFIFLIFINYYVLIDYTLYRLLYFYLDYYHEYKIFHKINLTKVSLLKMSKHDIQGVS